MVPCIAVPPYDRISRSCGLPADLFRRNGVAGMADERKRRQFFWAERGVALSFGELGQGSEGWAEREVLLVALRRLIAQCRQEGSFGMAKALFHFLRNNARSLALDLPAQAAEVEDFDELPRAERRAVLAAMAEALPAAQDGPASPLDRRVDFLMRTMALEVPDGAILGLMARRSIYHIWQKLAEQIAKAEGMCNVPAVSLMLGISEADAYRAHSSNGNLILRGLAEEDGNNNGISLHLHDFIVEFLRSDAVTEADMLARLLPVAPATPLRDEDFAHMRDDLDRARRLVGKALTTGARVNLFLYGPPGTGKTEFARLVTNSLGATTVSVGEADDVGSEPTRAERIAHLRLCRRLLARPAATVLLIDEADDLFTFGIEKRGSKLWLNRFVEEGSGPHVWIVNDPAMLGEPVVRRMDMAIGFELPHTAARRDIARRMVERAGDALALADEDAGRLADDLAGLGASPAIISAALRSGEMLGETAGGVVTLARDLALASGRLAQGGREVVGAAFDPALSAADCDLADLAARLTASPRPWSLLLSGPPGTGKSAFARHLAERAGIDVIAVSGSDLLRPYVGETEEQIAHLFARAERRGALLLVDEADSFLFARDMALRSWEVSMVNEMLRQMERGRIRFVATTNRAPALDHAAARRFTLRVDFAPLDAERARALHAATFGRPAPSALDRIGGLTPGDFAQARQRAEVLGVDDPTLLVRWLAETVAARDGRRAKLGF
ncbi:AAA family ATPase [Novosphingobium bradum]|uniref:AAA family ATPase n=1 Tax=Novosphingobium bradum TaxID=1737444 RepID=A0ABV7ITY2_9SPHN